VRGRLSAGRAATRAELAAIRHQLGDGRQDRISFLQGSAVAAAARRRLGHSDLQRRRSPLASTDLAGPRRIRLVKSGRIFIAATASLRKRSRCRDGAPNHRPIPGSAHQVRNQGGPPRDPGWGLGGSCLCAPSLPMAAISKCLPGSMSRSPWPAMISMRLPWRALLRCRVARCIKFTASAGGRGGGHDVDAFLDRGRAAAVWLPSFSHYLGPRHCALISDILLTFPAVRVSVDTTVPGASGTPPKSTLCRRLSGCCYGRKSATPTSRSWRAHYASGSATPASCSCAERDGYVDSWRCS
jgi:hypothetical protein